MSGTLFIPRLQRKRQCLSIYWLQKSCTVFFFSGARIDHGHHAGQAVRAVTDAVAMAKAVSRAVSLVDKGDDVTYIWVIAQV